MSLAYQDRVEAGLALASVLKKYRNRKDALLLALPRGGVPVAYQVAEALHLPLDVFLVRKLGLPGHEELAMGALAQGNGIVFNSEIIEAYHLGNREIERAVQRERKELARREQAYRSGMPPLEVQGKILLLVDDGLATGATMRAAVQALRKQNPATIVVAVPVAPPEVCEDLQREADEVVCPRRPTFFSAIGQWYEDFDQTSDEEVRALLNLSKVH